MAKFFFKRKRVVFILKPDTSVLVHGPQGLQIHVDKGKTFTIEDKSGLGVEITDPEQITRIRNDENYNTPEIRELTEEDMKAIEIRNKHMKLAEEEIKTP